MHFFGLFHCFFFGEDHEFLAVIGYDQACGLALVFIGVVEPVHVGHHAGYGHHGFGGVLHQLIQVAVKLLVIGNAHVNFLDDGGGYRGTFFFLFAFCLQNHILGKHFFICRFLLKLYGRRILLRVQPVAENRLKHQKGKACDKAENHRHGSCDNGAFEQLSFIDRAFLDLFFNKINIFVCRTGDSLRLVKLLSLFRLRGPAGFFIFTIQFVI